jgi:hypothetical protein
MATATLPAQGTTGQKKRQRPSRARNQKQNTGGNAATQAQSGTGTGTGTGNQSLTEPLRIGEVFALSNDGIATVHMGKALGGVAIRSVNITY